MEKLIFSPLVLLAALTISSNTNDAELSQFQHANLWVLIVGTILAFVLGFGMGANDVSNAFGTSVGSRALTLRQAYILASIFETLGAILVGYNVADTIRKDVVDVDLYVNEPQTLLLGQVAILGGCSIWLLLATFAKLPVSTTQSVVGATVGFSLCMKGFEGIQWTEIARIVSSWFISPISSGIISGVLYIIVDFVVLRRQFPLESGLRVLPIFYFLCIAFNTFVVSYQGSKILGLSSVPLFVSISLSIFLGLIAAFIVHFILKPRLMIWVNRRNTLITLGGIRCASVKNDENISSNVVVPRTMSYSNGKSFTRDNLYTVQEDGSKSIAELGVANTIMSHRVVSPAHKTQPRSVSVCFPTDTNGKVSNASEGIRLDDEYVPQKLTYSWSGFLHWILPARQRQEDKKTLRLFSKIQVFTACFAGFAHGANDVSNAIAPLSALLSIYNTKNVEQDTPIYVLLFGVVAICVGLCVLGHKVIKTVGQRMSEIHPASGFAIEFGAAVTTLCASKAGLPISTTHCLIGSVVAVGCIKAGEGIRWSIFRNVIMSWIVTLPVTALLSAGIIFLLKIFVSS